MNPATHSATMLFLSMVVSAVGLGFFIYGKKQGRFLQLFGGMGLMIYPYFVNSFAWMGGAFAMILAGMWLGRKVGL